ncbi:MAG: glucoamylase family protein [Bacteroidota bacterium]
MKFFFIVLLLISSILSAQSKPDLLIFDEDDAVGDGFYDASWGNVTSPSTLTLAGGSSDKLKIETTQHYSGNHSGLIQWKSSAGGSWKIFISSPNWAARDASGYDSLILFVNAQSSIAAGDLPQLGLESTTGKLSTLYALGDRLSSGIDGDLMTWQRVSIPLASFQPFNQFDPAQFKDINFNQNGTDNVSHTMWFDNVKIVAAASAVTDTTLPSPPKKIIARIGDKTMTLHWNKNSEQNVIGYNVYRSTSAAGPYSKMNSAALPTQSYFDVTVVNGQSYYYFVKAMNASQIESPNSDTVIVLPKSFGTTDDFLEYVQQTSFDYFWYEANPSNGLIKDRSSKDSPASIAAVGFGLTAIGIGVDHGYITRAEGRDRTLTTIKTFWNGPQGTTPIGMIGYKGWFYHFLDMNSATRTWTCELSSIDTGLLLAGMLYSKQYFNGTDSLETQIRALTDSIVARVDWGWMRNSGLSLTMGWHPESNFLGARWIGYNEAMILYIIGIGAQVNPLSAVSWNEWTKGYQWFFSTRINDYFVNFPPLFGHQYSHCWVDYKNIADTYMKGKGITYFENSRRATLDQRLYCIENPKGAVGYGANMWGITASDVPTGYNARGTNMNDDGTLNPTAPGGSMPFAPEVCIPALRNMYDTHRAKIWTGYGFTDAFNETVNWWGKDVLGIDQGPIIIMTENYRTGKVWTTFMKEKIISDGLQKAGFTTVTDVALVENNIPEQYSLTQNYPNPFNPTTTISYQLSAIGNVSLKVYDVLGREIATLVNEQKPAGMYSVSFDAGQLSSGIYFYKLTAGYFSQTQKMILSK